MFQAHEQNAQQQRPIERSNFEALNDEEFRKEYRLVPAAYEWVYDQLAAHLHPLRDTHGALTADQQLKIAIRSRLRDVDREVA